jgi:hypothetical protein
MSYSGKLIVNNINTANGSITTTSDRAIDGTLLAWINFSRTTNGIKINQIYNIIGITEVATGRFQISFPKALLNEGDYYGITGGGFESAFDGNTGFFLTGFDTDFANSNSLQFTCSDRGNTAQSPQEMVVAVIQ